MARYERRSEVQGMKPRHWMRLYGAAILAVCLCFLGTGAEGHLSIQELKEKVSVQPKLDGFVPKRLSFRDSAGRTLVLGDLLEDRPAVLALVYYRCHVLCALLMRSLLRSLNQVSLKMGDDFQVITVSVNPAEGPADAAAIQRELRRFYKGEGFGGWHFLTGDAEAIRGLASAVGVRYAYDEEKGEYAHPAAVMILTPGGRISRYLYGLDFEPRDLRLSLVEAAERKIGTLGDQVFLLCYRYDPAKGKYGFAAISAMRAAGVVTVLGLGSFLIVMLRRERRRSGAA